jgi:phage gp36-like protein
MAFATRQDLLARSNARRLAQLAVPTDVAMVPLETMRLALDGGDLAGLDTEVRASVDLGLAAIDAALLDAQTLIEGYGVPSTATSSMLTRIACTLALYNLRPSDEVGKDDVTAYNAVMRLLDQSAAGRLQLYTPADTTQTTSSDVPIIESAPARFGGTSAGYGWSET